MMRDERGAVMVIVGAVLLGLIFMAALVVDRANQFEHKRHLQLQVDAAALAGADSISLPLTACSNTTINAMAHNYGGRDANHATSLYNSQIGGTPNSNMHLLVNSLSYWSSTDPNAIDNSGGAPCDPANNTFCPGSVGVDIKGTETDLPWLLGLGLAKTTINAHSRVCLMQKTSTANSLPIAVPNPHPKSAAAIFVDQVTGLPIQITTTPSTYGVGLSECQNPPPPAVPTCPSLSTWTSDKTTVNVRPTTAVYIALSGLPKLDLSSSTLTGLCDQQLTTCFDAAKDPPTAAVSFIRGYSGGSGAIPPNAPRLGDVKLFPNDCTVTPGNAYFEVVTSACNVTLEAKIDIGTIDKNQTSFIAAGAGCPKAGCPLTKDVQVTPTLSSECLALSGAGECWRATIPVRPADGAAPITIGWNVTQGTINGKDCTKGGGCSDTFTNGDGSTTVQQAYTGNDNPSISKIDSGPLRFVQIQGGCTVGGGCSIDNGNSLPVGPNSIAVTVQIQGALRNAQSPSDPDASCTFADGTVHPYACLRILVSTGSSGTTQSIDCNNGGPNTGVLEDALALGCKPEYNINDGTAGPWSPCPSPNALNDAQHPEPWKCVPVVPGNKPSTTVANGINRRIYGTTTPASCPPLGQNGHNNWSLYDPTVPGDGFPPNDKRIVGVFLTAYGAFSHTAGVNGNSATVPITDFGTFYITGYDGSPCAPGAPTASAPFDDVIPDRGTIVGHFIKYVDTLNTGGGTVPCDPNSFGACVPVMTK